MTIYDKNQDALLKRFPELAEQFHTEAPDPKVGNDLAGDKRVCFVQEEDELLQLDSLYDMEPLLALFRDRVETPALFSKFFLFGLGNGCMAEKLLATTDSSVQIYVYEPNFSILFAVMQYEDLTPLFQNERFHLLVRSAFDTTPADVFSKFLAFTDIGTLQYYVYPNYNYLFLEAYLEYMSALEKTASSIHSSQSVLGRFHAAFFENCFANLCFLTGSKSLEDLYRRIPAGMPAIVVASGPSLDLNVSELKRAKGKALIIAADSALRTLFQAGVTPDLCVSIDPKKLARHFSNDLANDVPMVCQITSNHVILKNHRADKFFTNDLNQHIGAFFTEREKLFPVMASGGSVANDAFSVCEMLQFSTIIMVGQDLAYTGNKTHSASSVRGEKNRDINQFTNNVMTEDINGKPIVSSGEFTLYRTWIEERIAARQDLTIIDATEGGAKIYGSRIMTLREAISEYCNKDFDYERAIAETDRFMTEEERAAFLAYMQRIPKELELCVSRAAEGIRIYEQMLKRIYEDKYRNQGFKLLYEKSKTVTEFLEKTPVMEYVKNLIQNETTELLQKVYREQQDERTELIKSCHMGIDYLQLEMDAMERLIPMIREKLLLLADE